MISFREKLNNIADTKKKEDKIEEKVVEILNKILKAVEEEANSMSYVELKRDGIDIVFLYYDCYMYIATRISNSENTGTNTKIKKVIYEENCSSYFLSNMYFTLLKEHFEKEGFTPFCITTHHDEIKLIMKNNGLKTEPSSSSSAAAYAFNLSANV